MSVTSGETLNFLKEFLRVGTPSTLASAIVDVVPVLDVKADVCLGKVFPPGISRILIGDFLPPSEIQSCFCTYKKRK